MYILTKFNTDLRRKSQTGQIFVQSVSINSYILSVSSTYMYLKKNTKYKKKPFLLYFKINRRKSLFFKWISSNNCINIPEIFENKLNEEQFFLYAL